MALPETEENYPKLHLWLRREQISSEEFGARIGKSRQAVDNWRRAFGDRRRIKPADETMADIAKETAREVLPEHFYPPTLRRPNEARGGDPEVLRRARSM